MRGHGHCHSRVPCVPRGCGRRGFGVGLDPSLRQEAENPPSIRPRTMLLISALRISLHPRSLNRESECYGSVFPTITVIILLKIIALTVVFFAVLARVMKG